MLKRVRVSTIFAGAAVVALAGTIVCLRIDEATDRLTLDTLAAVLGFAVLPVTALAGLVSAVVLLRFDRSALRWVELVVSAALLVHISQVR